MRIGIHAAQIGALADPAALRSVAASAEQVGYSSLWVHDRLPLPAGSPPAAARDEPVLDPFAVLATAAAVTTTLRIGTSVVVAPWYRPEILARMLTTLDVLSDGRLTIGMGRGRSDDEPTAGPGLDPVLDALDRHWGGPGDQLRPAQRPRPPVLLSGSSDDELDRITRRADGWNPLAVPPDQLATTWTRIRERAEARGRDPRTLQLIVRADIDLRERPITGPRAAYAGDVDQVTEDLVAVSEAGADEVILHLTGDHCLDAVLDAYARLTERIG